LTTKWQLRSEGINIVAEFDGDAPTKKYTHKELMHEATFSPNVQRAFRTLSALGFEELP
jgi:hypothetical protein